MITQLPYQFCLVQKVLTGYGHEGMARQFPKISAGEKEFGQLDGIIISLDSQVRSRELLQGSSGSTNTPVGEKNLLDLFKLCFQECALSQFPQATMCTHVDIRDGWKLVECVDSQTAQYDFVVEPVMAEFFSKLVDILSGCMVYAHPHLFHYKNQHTNQITVGRVTLPIVMQLCMLFEEIELEYWEHINSDEDQVLKKYWDRPLREYRGYGLLVNRMTRQYNIIQAIQGISLNYQGYDRRPYYELLEHGLTPWMRVLHNWDIVLEY